MKESRDLTCIGCPMGCALHVEMEDGAVLSVSGNTCPRGDVYARKEVTSPTRIVTSTAVVLNGKKPRVSVKTANDIPKSMIFEVMDAINGIRYEAPVSIGDVLLKDAAGTGVDIIATKNVDRA